MTGTAASLATAVAALLVVLGLIGLGARAVRAHRRGTPSAAGQALVIRGVLALDARRRVYLITCEERRVLLLTGGGIDVVLGWLPPEHVP